MMTPQEVSSHAFTKTVMGGYSMAMVDEFLDELTDDYTGLFKENAALKAKLKVLVEKVEDYRATEDSMRATLLTAQKMADSIVHDAETKRENMIEEAERDIRARIIRLQQEAAEAEARLQAGKEDLARFIESSREICRRHMQLLDQLPELKVEVPAETPAQAQSKVSEIEESVRAAFASVAEDLSAEEPAEASEPVRESPAPQDDYPIGDPFAKEADDPLEVTRRINLDELKFGRNYPGEK